MMNRRQMVILPGVAALAAGTAFSQTEASVETRSTTGHVTHKTIARYTRNKSLYTVPKNANKQTKYIAFLTSYLSLTESQAAQAKTIFAAAAAAEASLKSSIKSSRKSLGASVRNNDGQGISQISSAIGSLSAQRHVIGANANAAFFAMLTSGQQAKLSQFRS